MPPVQVAHQLRVSTKSAYQWRRCWRAGGTRALASKGAGGAAAIMKNRLKRIQYRPALIDGFLAQTGLNIQPEPP